MAFNDLETADRAQSFFKSRSLLQGLIWIPIQLNAFYFAWDNKNVNNNSKLNIIIDVYRAIDLSLWKKDIPRTEIENYNNIIVFELKHLGQISDRFARARYFVRQWKTNKPLEYLRFVAGLFNAEGPTYQQLVIYCLSEVSTEILLRKRLEEVGIDKKVGILKKATSGILQAQSSLSNKLLTAIIARLGNEDGNIREATLRNEDKDIRRATLRILQAQSNLSDKLLTIIIVRLRNEDGNVKEAALSILQAQSNLSDELLTAILARLGDEDKDVRRATLRILQAQSNLSDELLTAVVVRLGNEN
ncbi:hypothetical protein QBC32DRAFT_374788 [Pseudoneurospora amorphoporcata]|uniref:DUF7068 domain-containing protein n=1 Tax=Pseudoneurospora amorphoporcata TaxID=241081 RepID=A0AAN6NM82_9PEZI|nr:hypothetical protein QBC32DRAFT_374788 [Pseudoneurospora amorphoporcata]